MKYFRSYPRGMQLLLLFLMTFTFWSFTDFLILGVVPKLTGFEPKQLIAVTPDSPYSLINICIWVQGIGNFMIFLVPAFIYAYLAHPRPASYLGLKPAGKKIQYLLAMLIMIGAWPLLGFIEQLMSHIDFGAQIKADQLTSENTFNAFLKMPDFAAFIKVFVIMAIVPAIGEEMFFRGILLRFVRKGVVNRAIRRADRTGNPVETGRTMFIPIIFTAAFFAMSHSNPYGYPSIFLAGVLLAVIYNLTGSLWCNIIGHLFFNGTQVILAYVGGTNDAVKKFMDGSSVPAYMIVSGAIVFGISFYLLWKNRTPLQANWSDDFTPMELAFFREENQS